MEELTPREIELLAILDKYESECQHEINVVSPERYWDQFMNKTSEYFKMTKNELYSVLSRIERTGCYAVVAGRLFPSNANTPLKIRHDPGMLTELYYNLRKYVVFENAKYEA